MKRVEWVGLKSTSGNSIIVDITNQTTVGDLKQQIAD